MPFAKVKPLGFAYFHSKKGRIEDLSQVMSLLIANLTSVKEYEGSCRFRRLETPLLSRGDWSLGLELRQSLIRLGACTNRFHSHMNST